MAKSKGSEKVTLKIPRPLYEKLRQIIPGTGYSSVTEFVVYVLRDLAATHELADAEPYSEAELVQVPGEIAPFGPGLGLSSILDEHGLLSSIRRLAVRNADARSGGPYRRKHLNLSHHCASPPASVPFPALGLPCAPSGRSASAPLGRGWGQGSQFEAPVSS